MESKIEKQQLLLLLYLFNGRTTWVGPECQRFFGFTAASNGEAVVENVWKCYHKTCQSFAPSVSQPLTP